MSKAMRFFAGLLTAALTLLPLASSVQAADVYKPFILASRGPGDMAAKVAEVKAALEGAGFQIVGDYEPYENAHIVIFTNDALKSVAAQSEYGGYAMAQRAAVSTSLPISAASVSAASFRVAIAFFGMNSTCTGACGFRSRKASTSSFS